MNHEVVGNSALLQEISQNFCQPVCVGTLSGVDLWLMILCKKLSIHIFTQALVHYYPTYLTGAHVLCNWTTVTSYKCTMY